MPVARLRQLSRLETLLVVEPPERDCVYTPTYTAGRLTAEVWAAPGPAPIKRVDYTYAGGAVTTEVRKVFAADGVTVAAQATWTYSYAGGVLTGATMTRDV